MESNGAKRTQAEIERVERVCARTYKPLPVALERGEGIYVWDVSGRRYFDFLSAYSALNFGHRHPKLVEAMKAQAEKLTVASRAFHNDLMGAFLERLNALAGQDRSLPMNTGAEAVETAIKAMRRWGYAVKKIPEGRAEIVVAENNFHGRTTAVVGFSSDPESREGFGPFAPGFVAVPFGDADALAGAINENTAGVLLEPIQGEAGVIVPPDDYLPAVRRVCAGRNVLLCLDEIQTGLGRAGALFAGDLWGVKPDLVALGKSLGGGLYPVSAVCGSEEVMSLFTPGSHGSTFGGNPLACAIGLRAMEVLEEEKLVERARKSGDYLKLRLEEELANNIVKEIRGRGLMVAVELRHPIGREICLKLMEGGILAKDTHGSTIRLLPPLIISEREIDEAVKSIAKAINEWG